MPDPALSYTHSGAVAGETPTFSGALSRAAGEDVGTYALLVGTLALLDNSPFLASNYTLAFTGGVTFEISAKNADTFTVGSVGPFEYDGTAHVPEPTVHDGATLLTKDTDYTLSYADNTNAGTATVTVTGIGNYTGTQDKEFEIEPRPLTVTPDADQSKTFGEAEPALSYTHSGAVAGETPAFSGALSRAAGEDVGTYGILVGTLALSDNSPFLASNYTLSFAVGVTFAITAKGADTFTVGSVGPFEYDGTAHVPEPTVHGGATLLTKDTDYTLSYADNTNAGTATVTVTGIGNYTGTQDKEFEIEPRPLTVTPDADQSKTFGEADPALSYTHSGAVCRRDACVLRCACPHSRRGRGRIRDSGGDAGALRQLAVSGFELHALVRRWRYLRDHCQGRGHLHGWLGWAVRVRRHGARSRTHGA